jgi:Uma2 family endonuclease
MPTVAKTSKSVKRRVNPLALPRSGDYTYDDFCLRVTNAWADKIKNGFIEGPPALAIEVVSPESVQRDYILKRSLYERAGVLEYWIIDPDAQTATFLVRNGKRFVKGRLQESIWHGKLLPGFSLDLAWLWRADRPRIFDLLRDHYSPQS